MQGFGRDCLAVAKELGKWVVLDADGLWMVTEDPSLIKGYEKAILTPNVMENKRLCEKMVSSKRVVEFFPSRRLIRLRSFRLTQQRELIRKHHLKRCAIS